MCGIAAFSLSPNSKLNARALAHQLLSAIEYRGSHAAGFAYSMPDGTTGYYKQPKPGSQLSLAELPRNATTVILHTRFATQGSTDDNRNNHPVMSPEGYIAAVHNGVISNDHMLRGDLGLTNEIHGEVDSLVIPALLEQEGLQSLSRMAGYAAIAWIDSREAQSLHIARLKSSPVAYTTTLDGSFVMASTPGLLKEALDKFGGIYGGVFDLGESKGVTIVRGFIADHGDTPRMTYNQSAFTRFSGATSGGHSTTPKPASTSLAPVTQIGETKGSEDSCEAAFEAATIAETEAYFEDLEEWRKKRGEEDQLLPRGFYNDSGWHPFNDELSEFDDELSEFDDEMDEESLGLSMALAKRYLTDNPLATGGFYILDHDGDIAHYSTLDELEEHLGWLGKMSRSDQDMFPGATQEEYWVNYVRDLGAVDEDGLLISWVDDMAEVDEYESPAVRHLDYIRGGIGYLMNIKGA